MPRHARGRTSRFVAMLTTGLVAGLPLLPAAPAAAAPPEISFSRDGLELLSCNSRPSDSELTVSAESTVAFRNRLGEDATLRIDGRDGTRVRNGEASQVLFHRGTVLVQLVPDCGVSLSSKFQGVSVTVTPAASATSGTASSAPAQSGAQSGARSSAPSGDRDDPGAGQAGNDRRASVDGSASAAPNGAPVGPASGGAAPSGAGAAAKPALPGDREGVAAEPLSPAATSGKSGPNGLLAIIAIVCIVGVSTGSIRAIFAQRATRTSAA